MSLKTKNRQVVKEVPWGMLVWQCADGEFAGDDDGNFMHVFLNDDDAGRYAMGEKALKAAAMSFGFGDGKAVYWQGKRPIDDEQLQYQMDRAAQGLVPDPLDIAAIRDEERALKIQNG